MAPYKWTPYRDGQLRVMYNSGMAVEEIGRRLSSTPGAIRQRTLALGLSRKTVRSFWTDERLRIFAREYPRCEDPSKLAEQLGTTMASLRAVAKKEGIRRRFWAKHKKKT